MTQTKAEEEIRIATGKFSLLDNEALKERYCVLRKRLQSVHSVIALFVGIFVCSVILFIWFVEYLSGTQTVIMLYVFGGFVAAFLSLVVYDGWNSRKQTAMRTEFKHRGMQEEKS